MSLPPHRHSQFDDPDEEQREANAALALQLAAAAGAGHHQHQHQHQHARVGPPLPPPHGAYRGGMHPSHPHAVPSMPPGHHLGHPPPPPGHHHPHHGGIPPHLLGGPPPGGQPGAAAFLHPSAFNSGLAAAIAAAEYQKQREATAAAHVFAAAHANGVQPFLPGGFPYHGHHAVAAPGPPPPQAFGGRGLVQAAAPAAPRPPPPPQGTPQPPQQGMVAAPGPGGAFLVRANSGPQHQQQHPGMSPPPIQQRPGSAMAAAAHHASRGGTASASPNTAASSNAPTPNPIVSTPASASGGAGGSGGSVAILPRMPVFSNGRPELPPPRWYDAAVPLGVMDDKYYLSELQCVLRSEFVEAFGTTQTDIVLPVHGRNKPIALGQVGIRCQHCKDISSIPAPSPSNHPNNVSSEHRTNRINSQNAISYPNYISGIYSTVQQMYRLHFDACQYIPDELKKRVANLKDSHTSNRGGRKQYWIDSAKRIGLVDTNFGIHYGRDPEEPLPPLSSGGSAGGGGGVARRNSAASTSVGGDDIDGEFGGGGEWGRATSHGSSGSGEGTEVEGGGPIVPVDETDIYPLVLPEDIPLISDYLYLALEQMQPCNLMDADRVGCYKGRRTGFPGLACKHCIGQAGCGRYFPASEASLSQTTTSQTIVNHVRNCRRCPLEIREQLELMKRAKTCPDYKKSDKPKHGGRKVFFHRLWCRIQRIPLPANDKATAASGATVLSADIGDTSMDMEMPPPKSNGNEKNDSSDSPPEKKKRKKSDDMTDKETRKSAKRSSEKGKDENDDGDDNEEVVETVEFDNVHDTQAGGTASSSPVRERAPSGTSATPANECAHIIYQGRTRLIRSDDMHWLSEADCFIRQELVEVFTVQDEEEFELFGEPECGQAGIRCFYCAEASKAMNRSSVFFPNNVNAVQQAVSDLQRRHLAICSEIPEDVRKSYQSMKGYGSKPKGDTAQYWTDAAKELGLHDSHEGQGISFFRNPLDNSPADEIDIEKNDDAPTGLVLVPQEDRSKCTDHMLLLLKQFEPCQFRSSDRKSSRSRDRALGFPGLVCVHCKMKRYFPITEKKLQDSLSLMTTHINNCFHAPLDVKASLCYLQHRSLLQKQELSGQWKFNFFKKVWNRLHQNQSATESSGAKDVEDDCIRANTVSDPVKDLDDMEETEEAPVEEKDNPATEDMGEQPTEEEDKAPEALPDTESHSLLHDSINIEVSEEPHDHVDALKEMKGLIHAAALWLSERDAEYEARVPGGGRGRGIKRR